MPLCQGSSSAPSKLARDSPSEREGEGGRERRRDRERERAGRGGGDGERNVMKIGRTEEGTGGRRRWVFYHRFRNTKL